MNKLHLIGNAHLDPVWLWNWQEGFSEITATFRSALDRMNEFPDYKFTCACAVYYQWIEKTDPEMFEEIKKRVAEGRWSIVGGWFLQPDCNLPCGESFARHGLISQNYFLEKFGVMAKTGYNVDSFGHNWSLPQILKKSGMDNYVFLRPGPHEKDIPANLFVWEGNDGSQVKAFRIPFQYCVTDVEMIKSIKEASDNCGTDYMAFFGVGNHGGGPTIKLINEIESKITDYQYSTPDIYFDSVDNSSLPVVANELQHHARGCYSAYGKIKKDNRQCENNILTAEKFSVLAQHLTGFKYPAKKLNKAWKNVLFNQFHDILGGCSIKSAYTDASYLHGETMSITEQTIFTAMHMICKNIDTLGDNALPSYKTPNSWKLWCHEVLGTPVVVFNPHCWTVKMPVTVNFKTLKVTDEKGCEIPYQIVRGEQTNSGGDKYASIFNAEVPPMGYRVYRVFIEQNSTASFVSSITANDNILENSKIKVIFSKSTGEIESFFDKISNRYILNRPCKADVLDDSNNDTWAHNLTSLGKKIGEFGNAEFLTVESGPVRGTIRIKNYYEGSVLQRDYSISEDSDVLTVKTKVITNSKFRLFKFSFPTNGNDVTAQIAYGHITRPQNTGEEPMGTWVACGDFAVATDAKYSYDTEDTYLRITANRTNIFADHYGAEERDEMCEYSDQGINEFVYSVFPYRSAPMAERTAEELNCRLRSVTDCFHKGTLPLIYSAVSCDSENIIVTALKKAEESDKVVIRFFDAANIASDCTVTLFDKPITSSLKRSEIKTYTESGIEVNLIEK